MTQLLWGPDAGHFTAMRANEAGLRCVLEASRQLEEWASTRPEINPKRIYTTCLCLAEPVPGLGVDALVAGAMGVLWIFSFDDLVDEGRPTSQEVAALVERYSLIAHGAAEAVTGHEEDPLGVRLQEVCDALSRQELFDSARRLWAEGLSNTLRAMLQEHEWRQQYLAQGVQPTYSEYIENGLRSIAGAPYIWMALIGLGDASVVHHAAHLARHMRQSAICVRLANDLRSYRKELAEGNINSITVHAAAGEREGMPRGEAVDAARHRVEREITQVLAACERNARDTRTATGYPELAIRNIARWNWEFYSRTGYLTYRPGVESKDSGWTSEQS